MGRKRWYLYVYGDLSLFHLSFIMAFKVTSNYPLLTAAICRSFSWSSNTFASSSLACLAISNCIRWAVSRDFVPSSRTLAASWIKKSPIFHIHRKWPYKLILEVDIHNHATSFARAWNVTKNWSMIWCAPLSFRYVRGRLGKQEESGRVPHFWVC